MAVFIISMTCNSNAHTCILIKSDSHHRGSSWTQTSNLSLSNFTCKPPGDLCSHFTDQPKTPPTVTHTYKLQSWQHCYLNVCHRLDTQHRYITQQWTWKVNIRLISVNTDSFCWQTYKKNELKILKYVFNIKDQIIKTFRLLLIRQLRCFNLESKKKKKEIC